VVSALPEHVHDLVLGDLHGSPFRVDAPDGYGRRA
jgi:hypothetical protein